MNVRVKVLKRLSVLERGQAGFGAASSVNEIQLVPVSHWPLRMMSLGAALVADLLPLGGIQKVVGGILNEMRAQGGKQ